jgi:hypothetical protein
MTSTIEDAKKKGQEDLVYDKQIIQNNVTISG